MPTPSYGTMTLTDLLNTRSQNVVEYGENRLYEQITMLLDEHNALVAEQMAELVEFGEDDLIGTGGPAEMAFFPLDEYGTPDAQKVATGANLGFPLRGYGGALQWTRLYFLNATVADVAAQVSAMMTADIRNVQTVLRTALYTPTNYTFTDVRTTKRASLPVKALANADSFPIPIGPNGETFDASTHTHYLTESGLTATGLSAAVATVRQHYSSGEIRVVIAAAQESAVRGLVGFYPYVDARIRQALNAEYAMGMNLDVANPYNRAIGLFDGAEVWVKPWAVPNYLLVIRRAGRKVLRYRRRNASAGTLQLVYEDETHPLRARVYEREFGIGVQDRIGAAVHFIGHASVYSAPANL